MNDFQLNLRNAHVVEVSEKDARMDVNFITGVKFAANNAAFHHIQIISSDGRTERKYVIHASKIDGLQELLDTPR